MSGTRLTAPTTATPLVSRRPRAVVWLLVAVVASLWLGGCGSAGGSGTGSGSPDLNGKSFTSTEVRGRDLVAGTSVTLSFEEGRISAKAGCNTMTGSATWDTGKLVVAQPLASTMMGCDQALAAQDQWLSGFLTSSPALMLDGNTLTLGDDTNGMTLTAKQ